MNSKGKRLRSGSYISKNGLFYFDCPLCSAEHAVHLDQFIKQGKYDLIKEICPCGGEFTINLNAFCIVVKE